MPKDTFPGDDLPLNSAETEANLQNGFVFDVEGTEEAIEAALRPALEKGRYLARIKKIEPKFGAEPKADGSKSVGMMLTCVVNTNVNAIREGWKIDDETYEMTKYVWIGDKKGPGRIRIGKNNTRYANFLIALNITELAVNSVLGRQLIVGTGLEYDSREEAPVADANGVTPKDTRRQYPTYAGFYPYTLNGEVAPVLEVQPEAAPF